MFSFSVYLLIFLFWFLFLFVFVFNFNNIVSDVSYDSFAGNLDDARCVETGPSDLLISQVSGVQSSDSLDFYAN